MASQDRIFGIHAEALGVQRRRMEVLSANIANADTPGFKARDIDFAKVLAAGGQGAAGRAPAGARTDARHLSIASVAPDGPNTLAFRVAMQPSADGNTVDVQVEQAKFADAALHYQASLQFADGRIRGLMTAITGQ